MNFQKIARQVWYYLVYVLEKDMAVAILKGSWAFLPLKLSVETSLVEFGFKLDCSFLAIKWDMCWASAIYLLVLWVIAGGKVHVSKSLFLD